jgi:hypothetical protein
MKWIVGLCFPVFVGFTIVALALKATRPQKTENVILRVACVEVGSGITRCQNAEVTCYHYGASLACVQSGTILRSTTDNDDDK